MHNPRASSLIISSSFFVAAKLEVLSRFRGVFCLLERLREGERKSTSEDLFHKQEKEGKR